MAFLILAKSLYDLNNFLMEFRNGFGEYILEQEILTMTSVHRFNLKFFYQSSKTLHTQYPTDLKEPKIDNIDIEIIKNLANNSRISLIELAQKLKIDSSTIIYRINGLKKDKIIGTYTLAINFDKFEVQHFQINFKLKNYDSINKIINYLSSHKNATFATITLGKYDLAIELAVKDNKELKVILDNLKERYSDEIINHDTFLITKEYNVTWFPYESN